MVKNWISSPFGINVLKLLFQKNMKNGVDGFADMSELLKKITVNNILFLLGTNKKEGYNLEKNSNLKCRTIVYENRGEAAVALKKWVKQYGGFDQFNPDKYILPCAKALLTNICMYKGTWQNSSTQVKVHNSFSYTEDIKYEVRVLEMPTNDADVGLVIIVPNETDVLDQLVTKLHRDGLSSAISSIQPSFTATCKQTLPTFAFNSAIAMRDDDHKRLSISQYGEVKVDQGGVDIKVLTCLPIGNENVTDYETAVISNKCFNFAIVCKDVPLFTGQVLP